MGARDIHELGATFMPFTAHTSMSGVNLNGREIRKGSDGAIETYVREQGGHFSHLGSLTCGNHCETGRHTAGRGRGATVPGVIYLKDIVKGGIKERFAELRRMGIKTVMITGDNPLTAATAVAAEAGWMTFWRRRRRKPSSS